MRITDIRCYVVEGEHPPVPFRWRKGLPGSGDGTPIDQRPKPAILRVDTDEGITGATRIADGEAVASLTGRRLKSFIGDDALLTERLWTKMWEIDRIEETNMAHFGLIDLLAWDLKSKKAGLPAYKLLGGNDPKIPAYASTVTWNEMGEYERHIKECADEGFVAFKLHAWGDWREDAKLCRNLRKWTGDDATLMFDGSAGWDLTTSLRFGRVLEEYGFYSTAFTYKGKAVDLQRIGRELNVRYVLEGSVQRAGNRMRVNVQLIEVETGRHLWAERSDKPLADLFDMQDEIVSRLANQLNAELIAAEARRDEQAPNPDSMDFYLQGRALLNRGFAPEMLAKARGFFERALELDPGNIDALVGVARVDVLVCLSDMTDDPQALLAEADAPDQGVGGGAEQCRRSPVHGRRTSGDLSGSAKRRGTGAGAGDRPEFGRGASVDGLRACLHGQGTGSRGPCPGSLAPEPARRDDV